MKFIKWCIFSFMLASIGTINLQAMDSTPDTEFDVIITTDYSIDITTIKNGKKINFVVHPNELPKSLGKLLDIDEAEGITILRHGDLTGLTTAGLTLLPIDLSAKWRELQQNDNDPLVINITSENTSVPLFCKLVASYSTTPPAAPVILTDEDPLKRNPLSEFVLLKPYATKELLSKFFRLAPKDWKTILVPGMTGGWFKDGSWTAEDVYRYILGVKTNYTLDDVKASYKALSPQWHTDKNRRKADAPYKDEVMKVINHAYQGLLQALRDKNPSATSSTADVTQ